MKASATVLILLGLFSSFCCAAQAGQCSVDIKVTPREGSEVQFSTGIQEVFDLTITNSGSCAVTGVNLDVDLSSGASITESWNLVGGVLTNFGESIQVGGSATAGFILQIPAFSMGTTAFDDIVRVTVASIDGVECSSTCASSSSPTSSPSAPPSSESESGVCTAGASIKQRASAHWITDGVTYNVFDISVTNAGSCRITNAALTFPDAAKITQSWNYVNGAITLPNPFGPNMIFTGAGFVLPATASASDMSLTYSCSASCPVKNPSQPTTAPSAPSTPAPSESGSCSVAATIAQDAGVPSWTDDQGRTNSVYRLTATNNGACTITDLSVSLSFGSTAEILSFWNLNRTDSSSSAFTLTNFGSIGKGSSASGVGIIVASASSASVTVLDKKCNC